MKFHRLWPRSSVGRSFLLLTLLLLTSQGSVYLLFHSYVLDPAAQRFARLLWQIDEAQANSPPNALGWKISQEPHGTLPQSYFLRHVSLSFARLGTHAQLRVQDQGNGTLWFWLHGQEGHPWLGIPIQGMAFIGNPFTLVRLLIILMLTVLGAWLIVWQINRPLARLANSAPRIMRGEFPEGYPISRQAPIDIQELERTITGMAEDLHRLHEERTLLLTGISHELRTPLSRLMLSLHLSPAQWSREQPAMLADVEEMETVLGNFLAWVQGGEQEKPLVISARQWFEEMGTIARERYGLCVEEGIQEHECQSDFLGRPIALERVFRNLFDNSRRYGNGQIRLELSCAGTACFFRCTDLGGESVSRALVLAMNEGSVPRQQGHGSGMGIRLCHRLLALQGGTLHYTVAPNGGLSVEIGLPKVARTANR